MKQPDKIYPKLIFRNVKKKAYNGYKNSCNFDLSYVQYNKFNSI